MQTVSDKKFAAFILSHQRPGKVVTAKTLRASGYTGDIYILLDSEDETAGQYVAEFGKESIIIFDKADQSFDIGDSQQHRRGVIYARNASFQVAKDLGLDYFLQLDDDYNRFEYRYPSEGVLKTVVVKQLDQVFDAMLDFLDDTKASTVAFAQGGDFIGGANGGAFKKMVLRKAMNSFFFCTDRPVEFVGRINEDVNTYVVNGTRGQLFLTPTMIDLVQTQTQASSGGMTSLYTDSGTYLKSMYSVMMAPSCVSISPMGPSNPRLHHKIRAENAYPKIISEKHCKLVKP